MFFFHHNFGAVTITTELLISFFNCQLSNMSDVKTGLKIKSKRLIFTIILLYFKLFHNFSGNYLNRLAYYLSNAILKTS